MHKGIQALSWRCTRSWILISGIQEPGASISCFVLFTLLHTSLDIQRLIHMHVSDSSSHTRASNVSYTSYLTESVKDRGIFEGYEGFLMVYFSSVQLLSHIQLFVTPWTAARQASLSITNSWSLLRLMSIELVIPSNHLILCCPLLLLPSIFPSISVFPMSQFLTSGGQNIGTSASASVFPINIQD